MRSNTTFKALVIWLEVFNIFEWNKKFKTDFEPTQIAQAIT